MKKILLVLLVGIMLCGCKAAQAANENPTIITGRYCESSSNQSLVDLGWEFSFSVGEADGKAAVVQGPYGSISLTVSDGKTGYIKCIKGYPKSGNAPFKEVETDRIKYTKIRIMSWLNSLNQQAEMWFAVTVST